MKKLFVVCVDDEAIITQSLKQELRSALPHLGIEAAYSGEAALRLLDEIRQNDGEPAVLVTDERMPGMPGHILLREARRSHPQLYGILLTGYADIDAIAQAVNEAGLFRYIHKPWERRDLLMAVRRAAELYDSERELAAMRLQVEQLNRALVTALESCGHDDDPEAYAHVQKVACYAALLGRQLGLPVADIHKLYMYAPLHDIGKAGIPHEILARAGTLSAEEFEQVKRHVEIGNRFLKTMDIDSFALDLILYHHEHWDGTGYLAAVSGERIPLPARITALADVLDAMLRKRPYKPAKPFEQAVREIQADAGSRFDPAVVEAFMADLASFRRIADGDMDGFCKEFRGCT
jgi:putative two-component system response regulator